MTALHYAAYSGDLIALNEELADGSDVTLIDEDGLSALHWLCDMSASIEAPLPLLAALIKAGADINSQTADGTTPLMLACLAGAEELATALLERGANPNLRSAESTALHDAAMSPNITRALLNAGSLMTERNSRNMLPIEHARFVECVETIKVIEEFERAR